MTYGAVFPPLAVGFMLTLLSVIVWWKMKLGRFLGAAIGLRQWQYIQRITQECLNAVPSSVLYDVTWMIIIFPCCFYTLFLFDLVGSKDGFEAAIWVFIVVPLFPVYLYAIYKIIACTADTFKQHTYTHAFKSATNAIPSRSHASEDEELNEDIPREL